MAQAVARVACLGSSRGHHARPCGTRQGTDDCMLPVSWLDSWALSKALWQASWHGRWHTSRVLAQLVGTMQSPVARVMAPAMARVTYLDSACGHHARTRGTRHGTSGGKHPVSWLDSWAPCKAHGTRQGTGGGTRHMF